PRPAPPPPRLVAMLVVDGLRADMLRKVEKGLGPRGLRRLFTRGVRFAAKAPGQAAVGTGPGDALLSTGTYPHANGRTSEMTFDRQTRTQSPILFDAEARDLEAPDDEGKNSSAKNLLTPTIADWLKARSSTSKALAVAPSEESAILLGGRGGQ